MPGGPPLVLASGSAGRRSIMAAAGLQFTVRPVDVDEAAIKSAMRKAGSDVAETALALANAKAAQVEASDALVIGADQMLVCEGVWFDKPPNLAAARTHLLQLRGSSHELVTAVVCWRRGECIWQHLSRPRLVMRPFSDAFLDAYLAAEGDAVLSSVGAYRLEGLGIHLFEAIEGEQAAILGLPMLALLDCLRRFGVIGS